MKHFLDITQLTRDDIDELLERALHFKYSEDYDYPNHARHSVATLFYENSTRTRVSFQLAAQRLAMPVINVDLNHSSENKGETIEDSFKNLAAMGIECFVLRHSEEGLPQKLAEKLKKSCHVINAGEGKRGHPSQAMLDLMTISEKKPNLSDLKITVIGNIRHSRVANSFQQLCKKVNVGELVFVAPEIWQPEQLTFGTVTTSLEKGLKDADVIMCLRVQHERIQLEEQMDLATYQQHYRLSTANLYYAKKDAFILHPGPINRGVEITDEAADGPQSCILQQVENGVYMRMAIFDLLLR